MSKHKPSSKDKGKSGQLVIRIEKSERAAFIATCEALDTTAAREIRRFMREFVAAKTPQADAAPPALDAQPAVTPVADQMRAETLTPDDAALPEVAEKPKKERQRVKS